MTPRRRLPLIVAGGLMVAGLVACGDGAEVVDSTGGTVPNVGQLGQLQTGRGPDGRPAGVEPTDPIASTPPTPGTGPVDDTEPDGTTPATTEPTGAPATTAATGASAIPGATDVAPDGVIGAAAAGNRILALGDSITAAVGPQYGGQLCEALERQGWFLGVDAFQGRSIDAGLTVVRSDIDPDEWDAVIVNLGSNYRGDPDDYAAALRQILNRFRSQPVLLVTVSEFEDDIAEVNYVVRDVAARRARVWVVEWSEATRDDGSLTGGDGLHLSESGRVALADLLAAAVGEAPRGGDAEPGCERLRDAAADASGGSRDEGDGDDGGG